MNLTRTAGAVMAAIGAAILTACSPAETPAPTSEAGGEGSITITDVKDRTVTLDEQPDRIILGEGRGLFATSILNKDNPVENVVALGDDLHTATPSFEHEIVQAAPQVADLPTIGNLAKGDVSVENLLTFDPDVLVMTADHYDALSTNGMLDKLDQAQIPYVVTDFRQHPLTNTTASMDIYGQLFGEEETAAKFNREWTGTVDRITQRVKDLPDTERPSTFVWRAAGLQDCCSTVAKSNLGEFVTAAGGTNIADSILTTESGEVTAEKVLTEDPEVVIATGGSWAPKSKQSVPHAQLGYATDPDTAADTLAGLLSTPGFDQLSAPENKRFFGVWHQFYDSPLNFLAVEQFAAWLHPELFADVDTAAHWEQVHEEYMPFPAAGTFFSELR